MKVTDVIPPFPERVRASQNFGSRILGAGQRPCQVCFRRDRFGEQVLRDFAEMRRQPTPASNCATLKTLARAVQDSAIGGPSRTPGFPSAASSCSRFRPALTGRLGVTTTPRLCPTPGSCTRNTGSDAMSDAWTLLVEIFDTRAAGQSDRVAVFAGPLGSGKTLGAITYTAMMRSDAGALIVTRRIAKAVEVADAINARGGRAFAYHSDLPVDILNNPDALVDWPVVVACHRTYETGLNMAAFAEVDPRFAKLRDRTDNPPATRCAAAGRDALQPRGNDGPGWYRAAVADRPRRFTADVRRRARPPKSAASWMRSPP